MSGLATLSVLYVGLTDECMEFQGVLGTSEFPPVRPEVRKLWSRWPEVSFSCKVIICFFVWGCLFLTLSVLRIPEVCWPSESHQGEDHRALQVLGGLLNTTCLSHHRYFRILCSRIRGYGLGVNSMGAEEGH